MDVRAASTNYSYISYSGVYDNLIEYSASHIFGKRNGDGLVLRSAQTEKLLGELVFGYEILELTTGDVDGDGNIDFIFLSED